MGRPGYWQAADGEMILTTTTPSTTNIVSNPTPVGRTLVRVIGDIRIFGVRPPVGQAEIGVLGAVHLLGAGADIGAGNQNAFPDAWLWRARTAVYAKHWSAVDGRFTDTVDIHFDVSGKRIFTASRPTARLALQLRDVAEPTGFVAANFSTFTRVLFAASEGLAEVEALPLDQTIVDDRDKADPSQPPIYGPDGLP